MYTIHFGKYKGHAMNDIINKDPKYMVWLATVIRNKKQAKFILDSLELHDKHIIDNEFIDIKIDVCKPMSKQENDEEYMDDDEIKSKC